MKSAFILGCILASLVMAADVPAAMNCYVIGTITDAAGALVGGATVTTHVSKTDPQVTSVKSLPEGKFMTSVPSGIPYWVKAAKAGMPTSWSAAAASCAGGGWVQVNVQMK